MVGEAAKVREGMGEGGKKGREGVAVEEVEGYLHMMLCPLQPM